MPTLQIKKVNSKFKTDLYILYETGKLSYPIPICILTESELIYLAKNIEDLAKTILTERKTNVFL